MITYQGNKYKELKDLASFIGINTKTLRARIKRNWPEDRWGEPLKENKIKYKGNFYPSISKLASEIGVSQETLNRRIKDGIPESEWSKKHLNKDEINYMNKTYSSIPELAKELGIHRRTLSDRIKNNWPQNLWDAKPEDNRLINYKDKEYKSIAELAKYLEINQGTLAKRIREKWPQSQWAEPIIRHKKRFEEEIEYKGKKYNINKLADHIGISKENLKRRILLGWTEDKWDKDIISTKIFYKDKEYDSIQHVLSELGILDLHERVRWHRRQGLSLEESIDKALKNESIYSISYKGRKYESIAKLASHLGLRRETLNKRIRSGWPQERWGEVGRDASVYTGYNWEQVPIKTKEVAIKLSIGLNIEPIQAYQLLIEKAI